MLTQQKTREEARTDHTGRGVEKEAIPVHESEKHYAECLTSIVSCREKLQEQQVGAENHVFFCHSTTKETVRGSPFFFLFFCNGSGSLARVMLPCSFWRSQASLLFFQKLSDMDPKRSGQLPCVNKKSGLKKVVSSVRYIVKGSER